MGTGVDELARLVPFLDCTPEQLQVVASTCQRDRVPAGTVLARRGARGDAMFVLVSGSVQVRGEGPLDGELGPGDIVGELAMLSGEPRSADLVAAAECDVLVIREGDLAVLLDIPPVAARLRAIAGARLAIGGRSIVEGASVPVIAPRPRVRGTGAGIRSREEVPARPVRTVVLGLLALGLVAGGAWFLTERSKATVVGIDQLLAEAREPASAAVAAPLPSSSGPASDGESAPTGAAAPADLGALAAVPVPAAGAPVATSDTTSSSPGGGGATAPDAQPTTVPGTAPATAASDATPGRAPFVPPAAGVYTYATTGSERINIGGASRTYPAQTHARLQHTGGCGWHVDHYVLEEHVDVHDRCSEPDVVSVLLRGTRVEFFGQSDELMYVCDPPARTMYDAPPGSVSTGRCATANGDGTADYEGRFVGYEDQQVGGETVPTAHLHITFTMAGRSEGTSSTDVWLHTRTGMIVREQRVVDTQASAVWGQVHYQEEATFHLTSMTPRT